jgi:hypothetical protein
LGGTVDRLHPYDGTPFSLLPSDFLEYVKVQPKEGRGPSSLIHFARSANHPAAGLSDPSLTLCGKPAAARVLLVSGAGSFCKKCGSLCLQGRALRPPEVAAAVLFEQEPDDADIFHSEQYEFLISESLRLGVTLNNYLRRIVTAQMLIVSPGQVAGPPEGVERP